MRVWLLDRKWPWMKRKPIRSLILPYIDPDSIDDLSTSDSELDPILQMLAQLHDMMSTENHLLILHVLVSLFCQAQYIIWIYKHSIYSVCTPIAVIDF